MGLSPRSFPAAWTLQKGPPDLAVFGDYGKVLQAESPSAPGENPGPARRDPLALEIPPVYRIG